MRMTEKYRAPLLPLKRIPFVGQPKGVDFTRVSSIVQVRQPVAPVAHLFHV